MTKTTLTTKNILATCLLTALAGCIPFGKTTNPIESEYYAGKKNAELLIILLPGIGESPSAFVERGVVESLQDCRPDSAILGVDAHFGYYRERNLEKRLHDDIIGPAKANGQEVWLIGNSLGGLGSLIYAMNYPEHIEWIALMAPFLGERDDLEAFITNDEQQLEEVEPAFVELWKLLEQPNSPLPSIDLGFGTDDKYSYQHQWLASQLPAEQVHSVDGKHRWKVWEKLWPELILASGKCSASP